MSIDPFDRCPILRFLHINLFPDPAEKEEKVRESVEKAKEAVALDVKDGTSWSKLFSASGSNGW